MAKRPNPHKAAHYLLCCFYRDGSNPDAFRLESQKRVAVSQRPNFSWVIDGSILGFIAGLIGRGGGVFIVPLLYV